MTVFALLVLTDLQEEEEVVLRRQHGQKRNYSAFTNESHDGRFPSPSPSYILRIRTDELYVQGSDRGEDEDWDGAQPPVSCLCSSMQIL